MESLGSDLSRKSECFVYVFNLKIEVIILLKEVQRKLSHKETNNRMVSFETQVLIQENGFRQENLQRLLRNAILYMVKVCATTRAVRGLFFFSKIKGCIDFGA